MSTCPNGHQSGTDDWCEVCGMRMSASPPPATYAAPPPPPPYSGGYAYEPYEPYEPEPTAAAEPCPNCGTPREGIAQFCEECRYNFITHAGTAFVPLTPPVQAPQFPPAQPGVPPYQRYESQRSRPSQMNRPAEPIAPESFTSGSGDFLLPPPSHQQQPPQEYEAPPAPRATWTAVITADRDYFTAMMSRSGPEASGLYFPSYSPEQRLPLTGDQLTIGRRRHSTGESPDIDLSRAPEDPGVSHQHALLAQQPDGTWSVIDQDSTNGTTLNDADDPLDPYVPFPLKDGDRVHVGAWTTITIVRD
jgi:hypothetical protein